MATKPIAFLPAGYYRLNTTILSRFENGTAFKMSEGRIIKSDGNGAIHSYDIPTQSWSDTKVLDTITTKEARELHRKFAKHCTPLENLPRPEMSKYEPVTQAPESKPYRFRGTVAELEADLDRVYGKENIKKDNYNLSNPTTGLNHYYYKNLTCATYDLDRPDERYAHIIWLPSTYVPFLS